LKGARPSDAGVTLIEVLVVLVLIGVLTSAVALSFGVGARNDALGREGDLLMSRLNRLADEVVLRGASAALVWRDDRYAFQMQEGEGWVPHPVPVLAQTHRLPGRMEMRVDEEARGSLVISSDLMLSTGGPAELALATGGGPGGLILFDGITARRAVDP
jgi:type II secretion system protein H